MTRLVIALRNAHSLLKSEKLLRAASYQELNGLELELHSEREKYHNLLEQISLWQQKLGIELHGQSDIPNVAQLSAANLTLQRQLQTEMEHRLTLESTVPWGVVRAYKSIRPYIPQSILRLGALIISRRRS